MSGNGYGSRDSVQAPLTLITAFSRLARSSTVGRSAHGWRGARRVRARRTALRVCCHSAMISPAIWVDRLDDREPTGMGPLHFHRITRVVAIHGKGGDEDRAVDPDLVHRRHHLVTRDVIGPVRHTVPGSF